MLKPLEQWICDACGEVIECPEEGYVLWQRDEKQRPHGFIIIHQGRCDHSTRTASGALTDFLGQDGLNRLLSFLSDGPLKQPERFGGSSGVKDLDEFVDFFRRVQTPYCEEARQKFGDPDVLARFSDANEVLPYQVDELLNLVRSNE